MANVSSFFLSGSVRTQDSYSRIDMQAALNSLILNSIFGLNVLSNGLSLANATHARAFRLFTSFSFELTCEPRYLKSSTTTISCPSTTSFVILASLGWLIFICSVFLMFRRNPTFAALSFY